MRVGGTSFAGASDLAASKDAAKLKQACRDFESIFLGYLLQSMRKTVSKGGLLDSGLEGEIFQEMMDAELCKAAANTSATGVAEMIYKQLSDTLPKQDSGQDVDSRGGLK